MMGTRDEGKRYRGSVARRSDPATGAVAIDYSGGNQTLSTEARGVYVGTAGHLKVDMADGTTVTFSNLAAGNIYPIAITKIYQTGSTAAGLVLL
jgi:hypothetical protein